MVVTCSGPFIIRDMLEAKTLHFHAPKSKQVGLCHVMHIFL